MKQILLCLLLLLPHMVHAQTISLAEVIRETLINSPDIPITSLSINIAKAEQKSIEGMLDPHLSMRVGYSDEKVPTTSPFAANKTQFGYLSGAITKPLQDGSILTGSLNYNRTNFDYPATVPDNFQSTINPIYQHQVDLTYRYPLLRGRGNPAYHEQLRASKQGEQAAFWRVEMLKEQLAEQVTMLYFQLAADHLSLQLAKSAVQRAEELLRYQKMREKFGLIEHADRLQAEALLATRQMEKVIAMAALKQRKVNLNHLMLRPPDSPLEPDLNGGIFSSVNIDKKRLDELLIEAENRRPVFRVIKANLEASSARLAAVRDQNDAQIDLIGQIGSRALDAQAGDAFAQGFTLNDRFISLSIEISDTLIGNAAQASIRQAELGRQQALLEQAQTHESVKNALASALIILDSAQKTVIAANKRADAEKNKFSAEVKRYKEGRSDTATIIQFEGDFRAAQLQAAMQKVSFTLARHQLALARGTLLPAMGLSAQSESLHKEVNP